MNILDDVQIISLKRLLLIVLVAGVSFNQMYCQFEIGLTGGFNHAHFFGTKEAYVSSAKGYPATSAGFFIKRSRTNSVNFGLEFNYHRRSADMSIDLNPFGLAYSSIHTGHFNLDYASVLFLPEYRWGGKVEGFVNWGLELSFIVAGTFRDSDPGYTHLLDTYSVYSYSGNSYFSGFAPGLVLGGGLSWKINPLWKLSLAVRTYLDLPVNGISSYDLGCLASVSKTITWPGWIHKALKWPEH